MRILVVGLGAIGQRHVRNLRALRGQALDLSAYRVRKLSHVLSDRLEIDASAGLEETYGLRVYEDLEQALAVRPDAVLVSNPTSLHLPVALAAAKAGCHLFVEKPLSHSEEGLSELIDIVARQNLIAMAGYQFRFHPCLKRLQALLAEGAIGRPLAVRAEAGEYLPGWHRYEDYRQMYAARADLGGGVILTQIHDLDYLYALFGLPARIFALGGHLSSLEVDVEDVASILMEFVVDGRPLPVHLHQDYVQRPASRRCEVIGDAGKISVDFLTRSVRVHGADGAEVERSCYTGVERNQLFLDEMAHFLSCLEQHVTPVVSLRDGANSLRMALAAKTSLATGAVVALAQDVP